MVIFLLLLFFCCFVFINRVTHASHSSLCGTITANDNRYYNACVLPAGHEDMCMTAEGARFYNDE